jgi:hypothetical protein
VETTCPKCNGPMVPLLTTMVCGRDCEKHPVLTADAAPLSEDVQRLRDDITSGRVIIPAMSEITWIELSYSFGL